MRGRKPNDGTTVIWCGNCGKKVVYRNNPSDIAGLAKRLEKAGKTLQEFRRDFVCTECQRKSKPDSTLAITTTTPTINQPIDYN